MLTTLFGLGWGLNGQLSVVQVVAFVHSLLTGFRWETFLIEPVIFLLWGFTALGMLFWGRGVYCGWLCPFGALQELLNDAAQRLGIRQIAVPQALHERLWVIKYTLFVAILALSFYSMHDAIVLAEVEPFKTAISLRMLRAWPFVLFVVALLVAGPVHRAVLLPLPLPAWRRPRHSGQAEDLRLAEPPPAMRPRMPVVRDEMHRRRHRPARPDQPQRMRPLPALPGDHERRPHLPGAEAPRPHGRDPDMTPLARLFSEGFRVFFLAAGLSAIAIVAIWTAAALPPARACRCRCRRISGTGTS